MKNHKLIAGLDKTIKHSLKYPSKDGLESLLSIMKVMIDSIVLRNGKPLKCDQAILPFLRQAIQCLKKAIANINNRLVLITFENDWKAYGKEWHIKFEKEYPVLLNLQANND